MYRRCFRLTVVTVAGVFLSLPLPPLLCLCTQRAPCARSCPGQEGYKVYAFVRALRHCGQYVYILENAAKEARGGEGGGGGDGLIRSDGLRVPRE